MKSKRCRWFCEWNFRIYRFFFFHIVGQFNVISSNQPFSYYVCDDFALALHDVLELRIMLGYGHILKNVWKCIGKMQHLCIKSTNELGKTYPYCDIFIHSFNNGKSEAEKKMGIFFVLVPNVISLCILLLYVYKSNPETMNGSMSCYHVIHGFI